MNWIATYDRQSIAIEAPSWYLARERACVVFQVGRSRIDVRASRVESNETLVRKADE